MSCEYCENYNGLNKFCAQDIFIETGIEFNNCNKYCYNNKLKHYNPFCNEKEVEAIIKNILFYFWGLIADSMVFGYEETEGLGEEYWKIGEILMELKNHEVS